MQKKKTKAVNSIVWKTYFSICLVKKRLLRCFYHALGGLIIGGAGFYFHNNISYWRLERP